MQLQIKTTGLEDYLQDGEAYIKALVMGEASAGKTRSASFWPKPIFADCEKGRMSIADRGVPYIEITTSDQAFALLEMLQRECMKPYDQRKYQTFVLDTLDAFQRKVIAERLKTERKESMSGWQDWGYLDAKMTMLVERMLNLPMNIVVNLHIKSSKDGDDGPLVNFPKLKGDLREQIANEFDLVGHMSTYWMAEDGKRVLKRGIKWSPEPTFPILKDRSGRLPDFTEVTFTEADFTGLLDHFTSGLEDMDAATDVDAIEVDDGPDPAPADVAGGPVPVKSEQVPRAAKKTAVKRAAASARANVPKAKQKVEVVEADGADPAPAQEQAADDPEPAADQEQEAVDLVTGELGGQVVSNGDGADESDKTTPEEPAAEERQVPVCGTPGRMRDGSLNPEPAPGCGKSLADENRDVVNIAFLKTRTYLCGADWAAVRAQAKK